jgi:hypothetical protein
LVNRGILEKGFRDIGIVNGELNQGKKKRIRAGFNSDRKITVYFEICKFFATYFFPLAVYAITERHNR